MRRWNPVRTGWSYVLVALLVGATLPIVPLGAALPAGVQHATAGKPAGVQRAVAGTAVGRPAGGKLHGHRGPATRRPLVSIGARVGRSAGSLVSQPARGCAATLDLLLTVSFSRPGDWSRDAVLVYQPPRDVRVLAPAGARHRGQSGTAVRLALAQPRHGRSSVTLRITLPARPVDVRDRRGHHHRPIAAQIGGTLSVVKARATLGRLALRLLVAVTCARTPARGKGKLQVRPSATPAATGAAPTAATSGGTTVNVSIKNFAFRPASLTIAAGTTVTWVNQDSVEHTVTASDGSWGSGNLSQGATYSHTFSSPGTYSYFCAIHPFMKATIVVIGAAPPTATPTSGSSQASEPSATSTAAGASAPSASPTSTLVPGAPTATATATTAAGVPSATATQASAPSATPTQPAPTATSTATPTTTPTSTPSSTPASHTVMVKVQYPGFSPSSISITQGTTVIWTNEDPFTHTVTDVGTFDSGRLGPGKTFSYTFNDTGTFNYACQIHPVMQGTVMVSSSSSSAPATSARDRTLRNRSVNVQARSG